MLCLNKQINKYIDIQACINLAYSVIFFRSPTFSKQRGSVIKPLQVN